MPEVLFYMNTLIIPHQNQILKFPYSFISQATIGHININNLRQATITAVHKLSAKINQERVSVMVRSCVIKGLWKNLHVKAG